MFSAGEEESVGSWYLAHPHQYRLPEI